MLRQEPKEARSLVSATNETFDHRRANSLSFGLIMIVLGVSFMGLEFSKVSLYEVELLFRCVL